MVWPTCAAAGTLEVSGLLSDLGLYVVVSLTLLAFLLSYVTILNLKFQ